MGTNVACFIKNSWFNKPIIFYFLLDLLFLLLVCVLLLIFFIFLCFTPCASVLFWVALSLADRAADSNFWFVYSVPLKRAKIC